VGAVVRQRQRQPEPGKDVVDPGRARGSRRASPQLSAAQRHRQSRAPVDVARPAPGDSRRHIRGRLLSASLFAVFTLARSRSTTPTLADVRHRPRRQSVGDSVCRHQSSSPYAQSLEGRSSDRFNIVQDSLLILLFRNTATSSCATASLRRRCRCRRAQVCLRCPRIFAGSRYKSKSRFALATG
jgi:hypothetical protein